MGVPTGGVSRHLNDTSALLLHLSGAEGPDPHRHLHRGSRHGSVSLETSSADDTREQTLVSTGDTGDTGEPPLSQEDIRTMTDGPGDAPVTGNAGAGSATG